MRMPTGINNRCASTHPATEAPAQDLTVAIEATDDTDLASSAEHPMLGIACAVGAFVSWGLLPLYFQWLKHIPPMEILAERIWWTFVTVLLVQAALGRLGGLRALVQNRRTVLAWLASSLCIGANWLIFVYAATHGQVLETSLGYFICPLLNVLLGVAVLGERLTGARILAVGLAACAVGVLIVFYAKLPLIALSLAASFAVYGLLRKQLKADPLTGLLGDTLFLVPAAIAYLAVGVSHGENSFLSGNNTDRILLYLLAPITLIPLGLFAAGAQRLPLATVGFVQYLAPTISFLCAIFVLHEPFTTPQLVAFALIWSGLALYTADAWKQRAG
jgi:chloramphenicol-sensitive protein RarD